MIVIGRAVNASTANGGIDYSSFSQVAILVARACTPKLKTR